eukprot:1633632-Pleurochrysis_carterae.AAC.1
MAPNSSFAANAPRCSLRTTRGAAPLAGACSSCASRQSCNTMTDDGACRMQHARQSYAEMPKDAL